MYNFIFRPTQFLFYGLLLINGFTESHPKKYNRVPALGVINGVPINIKNLPSAVLIFILDSMCAGSILNSWTILSAAHCFEQDHDVDDITVGVGATYINDADTVMYDVLQVEVHPQYNVVYQFDSDIALLFVDGPIKFGETAKKAILINDQTWMDEKEKHFKISGWGLTQEDGQVSEDGLLEAILHFVSAEKCAEFHHCNITKTMFCLYGNAIQDTCRGDSGGGVMWNGMVVGIVSHGNGCARKDRPSVYTNVYVFRDWIKNKVLSFIENRCKDNNTVNTNNLLNTLS